MHNKRVALVGSNRADLATVAAMLERAGCSVSQLSFDAPTAADPGVTLAHDTIVVLMDAAAAPVGVASIATGTEAAQELVAGNLVMRVAFRTVAVAGLMVDLTFTEFEFLRRLLEVPGAWIARDELARLLGRVESPRQRVDIHMYRLRRKLAGWAGARIETLRGYGYGISLDGVPESAAS